MNRSSAIKTMNHLGGRKVPFLFIIDFEMRNPQVLELGNIDPSDVSYDLNGITNRHDKTILKKKISFAKTPLSYGRYRRGFNLVQKEIGSGNTYLLNLTCMTEISVNLTLREIYQLSRAKYKLLYKNRFVVFSPERFIHISGRVISSNPMKGTIDASLPNAKKIILGDPKEEAEHHTIVDLIRNDLSIVAKNVRVEKFRYVDRIKTNRNELLQVSSLIAGDLGPGYRSRIGEIIFSLLPAGSVSGAPKEKTVKIIREAEDYKRGYYTGVFGYFNGDELDSGVMIRFIEKKGKRLFYKSGGGVTSQSDPRSEFKEMIDKIYVPIVRNDKN